MNIGISCHPSTGGSGILATELGIALAERGHTVHFVTYDLPVRLQDLHDRIFCHCVESISYPLFRYPPYTLALATRMSEVAEEYGVQVWHAHYAIPYAACALLARDMLPAACRFKVVTTLHGTDITLVGSDATYFRITRHAMENSDAVTAVSNWLNRETQHTFSLSRPVLTIYNFLNERRLLGKPLDRRRFAEDNEKIVMHISNFRPVKRVTDVVRAFKKIAERAPARLIMVGDGPERISAVGVVRQLGLSNRVEFIGNSDNIESILPLADLVFQPSEHESFGLVPLEAMACGVPVIGTASGGIVEVVEHGVTGFLCEVGDIDTMSNYAIDLLTNEELTEEMGRRGKEFALTTFSRDKIVTQYENLYRELI